MICSCLLICRIILKHLILLKRTHGRILIDYKVHGDLIKLIQVILDNTLLKIKLMECLLDNKNGMA
jgi:hypothetical protein